MGRNMFIRHVNDEAEDIKHFHPGCFNVLDYHHWNYNVNKILHHKKYEQRRHIQGLVNEETRLISDDYGEEQISLDDRGSHLLVNNKTKHTHVAKKRSIRARVRSLMAKESKRENGTEQKSSAPSRSLLRTYSIHHREPSDLDLSDILKNKKPTIIFLPSSIDDGNGNKPLMVPENTVRNNECSMSNASEQELIKEGDIILDTFKIDKDLSVDVVGSTQKSTGEFFSTPTHFGRKEMLTRSGSFPTDDLSRRRTFKPSKLEQKKTEVWFSTNEEKISSYAQVPVPALLKYKKHFRTKSWSAVYGDDYDTSDQKLSSVKKERTSGIIISSESINHMVKPHAEEGKSKESGSTSSLVEFSSRHVASSSEKALEGNIGHPANDIDDEIALSNYDGADRCLFSEVALHHKRSSFSESLDRYTKLYKKSSRIEVKLHPSKSLKLRNEYDLPIGGQLSFRRIRSLSSLDFLYPILNGVWAPEAVVANSSAVEGDTQFEEIQAPVPVIADVKPTLDACKGVENETVQMEVMEKDGNVPSLDYAEMDDYTKKIDESTDDNMATQGEENINIPEITAGSSIDGEDSPTYPSEGVKNICSHIDENENDSYINSEPTADPSTISGSIMKLESSEHVEKDGRNSDHSEFRKRDKADLKYLREVLERSGICRDSLIATTTWNSLDDPPLHPSVLEEMEATWHDESEYTEEDALICFHHQLLFDLINDELLGIRNRSFIYYPKALSYSCYVHLSPPLGGNRIIDEVTGTINTLLKRKPDGYQTLDNIASEDLAKEDGWMNHQLESEYVALQLEDIIFDEMLEEIMSS